MQEKKSYFKRISHPLCVCLVGWLGFFPVPLENFSLFWRCHHYRWKAANFDQCSAHIAIEQWGLLTPTVTRDTRLQWSTPRTSDTHIYCLTFGSGAVTTCLNVLHLSRLEFEHPIFLFRGKRSTPRLFVLSDIYTKYFSLRICDFVYFLIN